MTEEPRTFSLALWTPFSGYGLHIEFIRWNWERVVQDGYLSRQGSHLARTEPTWAERQVPSGTVGHCDISSDGLSFLWWPTQFKLLLAPSPILYHECETAKISRSAWTLRWQTGSGEYSYFLFRRWPTKVLRFYYEWIMMPSSLRLFPLSWLRLPLRMVPNVEERVPGSHSFSFTGNVYGGRGQQRLLFLSLLLQFWFELGPVATTDSTWAIRSNPPTGFSLKHVSFGGWESSTEAQVCSSCARPRVNSSTRMHKHVTILHQTALHVTLFKLKYGATVTASAHLWISLGTTSHFVTQDWTAPTEVMREKLVIPWLRLMPQNCSWV